MDDRQPVMGIDDLQAFMARVFPQVHRQFTVQSVAPWRLVLRMHVDDSHLRPGGTVSGPSMFALADLAFYLATLAMIGPEALAVTTNCAIDFMRKPAPGDLLGEARILKLGRSLSVGDVMIHPVDDSAPVARASLTYSIPPD